MQRVHGVARQVRRAEGAVNTIDVVLDDVQGRMDVAERAIDVLTAENRELREQVNDLTLQVRLTALRYSTNPAVAAAAEIVAQASAVDRPSRSRSPRRQVDLSRFCCS